MTKPLEPAEPCTTLAVGPIWRDANVRRGPALDAEIVEVLWPADGVAFTASAVTVGDEVVEGVIVSDLWFELRPGLWCSAVNFDQDTVARALATQRKRQGAQPGPRTFY